MAQRKISFVDGESYHIYNRGNNKRQIFHDSEDYERFKKMLYICNGTKSFKSKEFAKRGADIYGFEKGFNLVEIYAYVLMPNHFHLFLTPSPGEGSIKKTDQNLGNNVSTFLKRLTVAYARYYNQKYQKTGSLFEGKFKAEHVHTDEYYKYLFSYIHLNPLKLIQGDWKEKGIKDLEKATEFLLKYTQSSYLDYFSNNAFGVTGGKKSSLIINKAMFFEKMDKNVDLEKEIFEWMKFKKEL